MLQPVPASNYPVLPPRCGKQLPPSRALRTRQLEEVAKRSTCDLSVLYPQAVLKSSDEIGWQNVRAIHFRYSSQDVFIPAADDHCIVLNLGTSLFTYVSGKRRFEGALPSGQAAIIPAGSSWICRAEIPQLQQTLLLLYLRPLFVRS